MLPDAAQAVQGLPANIRRTVQPLAVPGRPVGARGPPRTRPTSNVVVAGALAAGTTTANVHLFTGRHLHQRDDVRLGERLTLHDLAD